MELFDAPLSVVLCMHTATVSQSCATLEEVPFFVINQANYLSIVMGGAIKRGSNCRSLR